MKKNFKLYDNVIIKGTNSEAFDGHRGVILGKSHEHIADTYIVMLDDPTETHAAICLVEGCLDLIIVD